MGKLMKYELRSMLRLFVPLWAAILALSVLNHFTLRIDALTNLLNGIPAIVLMIVYVIGMLAIVLVALAFLIQRFYVGLLKDEGYLMFTLPVKTATLIWAKCFSATILVTLTTFVSIASVFIMAFDREVLQDVHLLIQEMSLRVENFGGLVALAVVLCLILGIANIVKSVLQAYLSMSIGQLANKHKAGLSVLSYVGITIAISTVATTLMATAGNIQWLNRWLATLDFQSMPTVGIIWGAFGVMMVVTAIQVAVFYFPAKAILQHKLNLE